MRLHNIYYICKITVDRIRNMATERKTNSSRADTYLVKEWERSLESLMLLRKIPFLNSDVDKLIEIYSAIETSEEIKVQFPFTDDSPEIPAGLLKLIEDKQKEE